VYNLFKFIEDKRPEYKVPFKLKLLYEPESITEEELDVKGLLNLKNTSIRSLPDGLKVEGSLFLTGCKNLKSLPNDLEVGGSLDLNNTQIQALPKGLEVRGYLDLRNTPIQALPNRLKVEGSLDLNSTQIQSLPKGLKVGGNLFLLNTPLSKKYTTEEELKAKYPDLKIKGKIYI